MQFRFHIKKLLDLKINNLKLKLNISNVREIFLILKQIIIYDYIKNNKINTDIHLLEKSLIYLKQSKKKLYKYL